MATITSQPKSNSWKAKPDAISGIPAGLEHLATIDSIFLKQKIDKLEMVVGWESKNRWKLVDPNTGEQIGKFKEESGCCMRQCCKSARAFKADIVDLSGNTIFKMDRPLHCMCICCTRACNGCCGQEITSLASTNQHLGQVEQESSCAVLPCLFDWKLVISDENRRPKYRLENNMCHLQCNCCCEDRYVFINDMNGQQVGTVTKKWRGFWTECCTVADSIHIAFPADASAADKANIISAVMLTDYNLWERSSNE